MKTTFRFVAAFILASSTTLMAACGDSGVSTAVPPTVIEPKPPSLITSPIDPMHQTVVRFDHSIPVGDNTIVPHAGDIEFELSVPADINLSQLPNEIQVNGVTFHKQMPHERQLRRIIYYVAVNPQQVFFTKLCHGIYFGWHQYS